MDHLCSDGFGWGSLTAGGSTFVAGVLMLALIGTQKGLLGGSQFLSSWAFSLAMWAAS